jgi:hypothetical protein
LDDEEKYSGGEGCSGDDSAEKNWGNGEKFTAMKSSPEAMSNRSPLLVGAAIDTELPN